MDCVYLCRQRDQCNINLVFTEDYRILVCENNLSGKSEVILLFIYK
jgi:hypothetical protein